MNIGAGFMSELSLQPGNYTFGARRVLQADVAAPALISVGAETAASEVRLVGGVSGENMITFELPGDLIGIAISSGAPPVLLAGITFTGGGGGSGMPAITTSSSTTLVVFSCWFKNYRGTPLIIDGGTVYFKNVAFTGNGGAQLNGGAIRMTSGVVTIETSVFKSNVAAKGGGIFITAGSISISGTIFLQNQANFGGGMSIRGYAEVLLKNGTSFISNESPLTAGGSGGRSIYVGGVNSKATYVLPLPLGHWLTNSIFCSSGASTSDLKRSNYACVSDLYNLTLVPISGSLEDDPYPFACAPGVYGNSSVDANQTSPQCSGACPAGSFCPQNAVHPLQCPIGSFCVRGSAAPVSVQGLGTHTSLA